MKLTIQKTKLLNVLNNSLKFAPTQKGSGIGVFFTQEEGSLIVDAYSETRFITQTLGPVDGKFEGSFVLDVKKIVEFVNNLPVDEVVLEFADNKVKVSAGKTRATFGLSAATQERQIKKLSLGSKTKVDFNLLKQALSNVLFATAPDSTRPILTCVKIIPQADNNAVLVGTDGFRLSYVYTNLGSEFAASMQIPAVFLKDASTLFDASQKVEICQTQDSTGILFEQGDLKIFTRVIVGDFPPFERVLVKTHTKSYVVEKKELASAVKLMSIFARDNSNIVILKFKDGELTVSPNKLASDENQVKLKVQGQSAEEFSLAFNFKYVLDFLSTADDTTITLRGNTSSSPVVFLPGEVADDVQIETAFYQHVIMPVNVGV